MSANVKPATSMREVEPGLWQREGFVPGPLSSYKLAAFDMDSTLINIECIDEIADIGGRKAEVAAITEAAMRGEITDWRDSLDKRLAMLQGVPVAALQRILFERLRVNRGVMEFVAACQQAGLKTLLVSGGFTFFSEPVRGQLNLDFARAGLLEVKDDCLTGRLVTQDWGTYVDGGEKRRTVLELCSLMGISPSQAIAVGDGANDLPMMDAVGCAIAFQAKPKVREQADIAINSGGMDRCLPLFRA